MLIRPVRGDGETHVSGDTAMGATQVAGLNQEKPLTGESSSDRKNRLSREDFYNKTIGPLLQTFVTEFFQSEENYIKISEDVSEKDLVEFLTEYCVKRFKVLIKSKIASNYDAALQMVETAQLACVFYSPQSSGEGVRAEDEDLSSGEDVEDMVAQCVRLGNQIVSVQVLIQRYRDFLNDKKTMSQILGQTLYKLSDIKPGKIVVLREILLTPEIEINGLGNGNEE